MSVGVVDTIQHDVFKSDFTALVTVDIAMAGLHQFAYRVFAVDRHQLITQAIVRCMQRYRERNVGYLLQFVHGGHHAGGTNGNAALAQSVSKVVAHHIDSGDHRVEIEQRLAHTHHHDVGYSLLETFRDQAVMREMQLGYDFRGGQITVESLLGCRTKTTVERTSQLRRHAQGHARFFRNQYALDCIVTVIDTQQPLARAVGRVLPFKNSRPLDTAMPLQKFT